MKCYQCLNPAMWLVTEKEIPLCLHCYQKFSQIQQQQLESHERMVNYFSDHIACTVGLPPMGPRFPERPKPTFVGSVALNNIKIQDSVVGSINTGTIGSVDVAISAIKQTGETQLGDAITQLTQAVLASGGLDSPQKNEALEILSVVAGEAAAPKDRRRTTVVKSLLGRLRELISAGSDLTTIWQQWGTIVMQFFGN